MSRLSANLANEAATLAERAVVIGSGTTNLDPSLHANRLLLITNGSNAITINLPEAVGSGDVYKFLVTVARTSTSIIINAKSTNGSNVFVGMITQHGSANVVTKFASTTNDIITLNNTTQGAQSAGDYLEIVDGAVDTWYVVRALFSVSGNAATPFSG